MNDERLTDELAIRIMGWRLAPGRYIKPGRSWIPRSKFRPLVDVRDALRLVDAVTHDYSLVAAPESTFTARVCVAGRTGKAVGEPKARAICLALARALEIQMGHGAEQRCVPVSPAGRRSGDLS
jgi:hypothetical protein